MMFHPGGIPRQTCTLLAVTCGKKFELDLDEKVTHNQLKFPFPELISSGRLEVMMNNELC